MYVPDVMSPRPTPRDAGRPATETVYRPTRASRSLSVAAVLRRASSWLALVAVPGAAAAQAIDAPARLAGIEAVRVRADASWDEAITMEAGGATPDQFLDALRMTFESRLSQAPLALSVADDAATTVACHVDTFYDAGLIVYSLRVQTEGPGNDGGPVVTWIRSRVGSFTVQQLHLMFRLGEECAETFLQEWRTVN